MSTITSMWIRLLGLWVAFFLPEAALLIGHEVTGLQLAGGITLVAAALFPLAWHRLQATETA